MEHFSCASIIGRVGIAQLTIDVQHSLFFRVAGIFGQRVEDDGELVCSICILVEQHSRNAAVENFANVFFCNFRFALHNHLVALDRYNFARILVNEVFVPAFQHTGGQAFAKSLLHVLLINLNLFGQVEYLQDVAVVFVADGTQQRGYGQLLLTVDVGIHHVVDVGSELNPRTFEGDDTRRIEHRSVGMHALSEENAGRAVQLRHDNALGTVDNKGTVRGHIGNCTQENVLDKGSEIFVVGVGAV